jgi:hypothetical protein
MISPDILHQLIKGTFKDHLVTWVEDYIKMKHPSDAAKILSDVDRRIAAAPSFPGLRRFPEGRGFKQWTGDDSKALMKVHVYIFYHVQVSTSILYYFQVYLPAVHGYLPPTMVQVIAAFLDFCYLVRKSVLDEDDLQRVEDAVNRFHQKRMIFVEEGVRDGFGLPRQHSLCHYRNLIMEFGAPNGLCSSITESRHITAVKEPYRRSNKFNALSQMILTNQRLDKIAASRVHFDARGQMHQPLVAHVAFEAVEAIRSRRRDDDDDDDDGGETETKDIIGEVKLAKIAGTCHTFSCATDANIVLKFVVFHGMLKDWASILAFMNFLHSYHDFCMNRSTLICRSL